MTLLSIVQTINAYLSDYILFILLIAVGLWYSIKTRFVQVRYFGEGMRRVFGNLSLRGEKQTHTMTSFQALATAIAAQVGTGNIVGASGAILTGGPGAIFWMWIIAFFGMATIYAEATLAIMTRRKGADGSVKGGPVYYIRTAFTGGFGRFLAGFFAIAITLALGFFGCMVQSNSIGSTFNTAFGIPSWIVGIVLVVICAAVMLIVAYPLYYVLVASFSDPYDVYAGKTFLLPSQFTLKGYQAVFADSALFSGFINSIKYTVIGTIYSVVMIYLVAYPLSVKDLPGRKYISLFFVITMYFGGGLVPTYLIVKQTGLLGSMWALFLPGVVAVGNVIIVRNFFENNIPRELLEAAEIDGASKWTVFVKMVIPLSRSIMAVMVVYSMVAYWNDWFTALIYLRADQAPLPLVLRNILIKSSTSASQSSMVAGGFAELNKLTEMIKFASIIVAAAPMLIVYPFVQKYFEKGFMAGAVKG